VFEHTFALLRRAIGIHVFAPSPWKSATVTVVAVKYAATLEGMALPGTSSNPAVDLP
jgi:hypothetical protein